MKGAELRLIEYMEGSKKRFIIPVYQRNYDWRIENCKQLFDDLVKVVKDSRKSHFFGSLVSVYEPSGRNTEFLVIDGQQRLTTVSLLFLAMYNLITNGILIPQDESLATQIYEEFLVDKYQPKETRIKLKPVKNDKKAFDKLFAGEDEYIRESNLTANYKYFYERIQKQEVTLDELFDAICRLEIINITLNNEDNAQLIFESLNSTGLELSEGDKIRNFILMGLQPQRQEEYYEKYWNNIELCTKYDVSAFVRDYLSVKQQMIPAQKKIYTTFKKFVESGNTEIKDLLEEMLAYAKRYQILLGEKTENKALNACISRLNRLETTVTRPYFLEVLRLSDEKVLTLAQVAEIFRIAENFIFRRFICDIPTNALNKIFLTLHREIIKYDGTQKDYIEKLKYALLSKKGTMRFPLDDEFPQKFSEKPIYQNVKNRVYVLERFENFGIEEDKDVYAHCDDGTYSIEHIMPQTLTPAWQRDLGDDYEHIHELWLHRMANLTLTAYNSKYSNRPFEEKKTMEKGFKDSGIRMNTWIAQKDKWALEELKERDIYLTEKALKIWPAPQTEYKPAEKPMDMCTLDDDVDLTGRQIVKFAFRNVEQPIANWTEMFLAVIRILYEEDKSVIAQLAASADEGIAQDFSFNKEEFIRFAELGDGIYVWTNSSTQVKMAMLSRLFTLHHAEPSDLIFYLKDDEEETGEEPGSRWDLRKRYWKYALPLIKEAKGADEAFLNISPSRDNWVNGFFGISGFCISCVANYDNARVELLFSRDSKEENKAAFGRLWMHKGEIEAKLGTTLQWNNSDEQKLSKVFIQIDDVGIENEAEWQQVAQFHATWASKFCETIVPYVVDEFR